jgi:DNA-binding HxlR family transcriptional regulator
VIVKLSLDESERDLRDNGGVPLTARPDLPGGVDRALDILGTRVRVAVVRSLLTAGPSTRSQLSERIGISMSLLQTHLATLENLGAVELTPPRTTPGVRPRVYSVDPTIISQLVDSLKDGLTS